jgi:ribosomal protein L40E
VQQAPQEPPRIALRRTGANLPSVTAPPPILAARACPSCGLSLSANARFCRRCGTPQQLDAAR